MVAHALVIGTAGDVRYRLCVHACLYTLSAVCVGCRKRDRQTRTEGGSEGSTEGEFGEVRETETMEVWIW